eukprot:15475544-Alexandrium_andersonii.AAC.1
MTSAPSETGGRVQALLPLPTPRAVLHEHLQRPRPDDAVRATLEGPVPALVRELVPDGLGE